MAYTKQIWENLPSTNTPITADRLNHMEDGIYDAYAINNSYSTSQTTGYTSYYVNNNFEKKGTILWTNSSPTNDFASQNITLSSGDYDVLKIFFKRTKTENILLSNETIKGNSMVTITINQSSKLRSRRINYTNETTLAVADAYDENGSNIENSALIPLYVVGYKTGLFS